MGRFIAKDTKEPLVVLGGYHLDSSGGIIREHLPTQCRGDYGCDPVGDGTFRMIPSGDIVNFEERNRRLSR